MISCITAETASYYLHSHCQWNISTK